jgi:hypothetical protein
LKNMTASMLLASSTDDALLSHLVGAPHMGPFWPCALEPAREPMGSFGGVYVVPAIFSGSEGAGIVQPHRQWEPFSRKISTLFHGEH